MTNSELEDQRILLKKKYNTKLIEVDEFNDSSVLAQFIAETNTIKYKKEATNYLIFHESLHAEECFKIGKKNYLKGSAQYKGSINEQLLRTYRREKYVYERIKLNAKKQKFNKFELEHNELYMEWHTRNLIIKKLEIPK